METRLGGWIKCEGKNLLGKKLVDKSIFKHGTTIPKEEAVNFLSFINKASLEKGENEEITLLVDNNEFKSIFRNVNSEKRDDTFQIIFRKEIKDYIKSKLNNSYEYIFKHNEDNNIKRPQEYIEFYSAEEPNTFRI